MDLTSGLLQQVSGGNNNNKDQLELLDEFVTSRKFIAEPCVNSIISKSINLGFRWDIIKEVFKETMAQFLAQHLGTHHRIYTPTLLASIDLKQVFGTEERVIERILYASIQSEQQTGGGNVADSMATSDMDSFQQHRSHPLTAMSLGGGAAAAAPTSLADDSMFPAAPSVNQQQEQPPPFFEHTMDQQMQQFLYQQRQIHQQLQKSTYKGPSVVTQSSTQHFSPYLQSMGGNMNKMGIPQQSTIKIPPSPQELIARANDKSNLRPIIIDGNDVGLSSHSNKQIFSFGRICRAVEYFEKRNHAVFVLLPSWRKEQIMMSAATSTSLNTATGSNSSNINSGGVTSGNNSNGGMSQSSPSGGGQPAISPTSASSQAAALNVDQEALLSMEDRSVLYCTPSKRVGNKHIICNDDKMILNFALNKDGIIVSNDNFKKYMNDSEGYKQVIEERVLMYSFIDDTFMPVEDPLGKNGPTLDNFLRFESIGNPEYQKRCPYKKRCTYGLKCKYWHPERDPESMGNPMLNVAVSAAAATTVRSSSSLQQQPMAQQHSLHHIANLSQLPVSMHSQHQQSQQQQQFKTVNQNMHDRIQEQKLVLEQILSKQSESVSFFEDNGGAGKFGPAASGGGGYFSQQIKSSELDLRAMGPETKTGFVGTGHQMQFQPTSNSMTGINKQMSGMSLSNQTTSGSSNERSLYNPIVGSTYMPSFTTAASLMSQQSSQFGETTDSSQSVVAAAVGSRAIVSSNSMDASSSSPPASHSPVSNVVDSQQTKSPAQSSSVDSGEEIEIKQPRQLTPSSLRQRLASLLNDEQIELFMAKYKDVTDETEAMFLASTWTIKQAFDF